MILDAIQIEKYIRNPKNKYIISEAVRIKKEHNLHICGVGLDAFLEKVDSVENEDYIKVKKKLANTITVKSFEKVLRPKDKITTARGGSRIYEFNSDTKQSEKEIILENSIKTLQYNGLDLFSYVQNVWLNYGIWVDPMGLTFLEEIFEDGKPIGKLKINYISVYDNIGKQIFVNYHDFSYTSFNNFDYIILNVGTDKNNNLLYRVIDSEKDVIYKFDKLKDTITEVPDTIYFHGFGKVPAVFNSNKYDKKGITDWFTTYCSEAMPVAKDYLNDYTDFRIYKKKLGIPIMWRLKTVCPTCKGEGTVEHIETDGNLKIITCPACKGDGYNKERSLTDIIELDLIDKEFQSNIPPAGSVTMPIDIQEQLRKELAEMEFDLSEVVWGQGTGVAKESQRETTAFEVSVRNEAKIDKLRIIENNRILFEKSIIDLFGKKLFGEDFIGIIINPNTQFQMLTPAESREVYNAAKTAKAPSYQLDKLYDDYLLAEYQNDPINYEWHKRISLLTPMPHHEVVEVSQILSPEEIIIKKNIEKFIYRYENEDNGSIITDKLTDIYNKFKIYSNEYIMPKQDNGTIINNGERSAIDND